MHLQIAGVRTVSDAVMCAKEGFDIIGLLVGQKHSSYEFISVELACEIKKALPKNVKTTLITHLEDAKEIIEIAKKIDVDYIQLHSHINESEVEKIREALPNKKIIRLIHISGNKILTDYKAIKIADYYFTDSLNLMTDQVGGTGLVHDYRVDKKLNEELDKPLFLAGGLTSENVKDAIELVKPWAVDVNSGCRGADGYRDREKVRKFVASVKKTKV